MSNKRKKPYTEEKKRINNFFETMKTFKWMGELQPLPDYIKKLNRLAASSMNIKEKLGSDFLLVLLQSGLKVGDVKFNLINPYSESFWNQSITVIIKMLGIEFHNRESSIINSYLLWQRFLNILNPDQLSFCRQLTYFTSNIKTIRIIDMAKEFCFMQYNPIGVCCLLRDHWLCHAIPTPELWDVMEAIRDERNEFLIQQKKSEQISDPYLA